MNYLITGATGFIGSQLVGMLLAQGHSVNYLGRQRSRHLDSRAAFHYWKMNELPPLDSVPRLDVIIHLTGEPIAQHWTPEVKRRISESRISGTRKLVAAIGKLEYKPSTLISSSAIGYYGNRGDEVLTEESSPGSDFLAQVCREWEQEAVAAREFGLRVVPIRTGIVLGRNGGALKHMLPPFRLGLGGKLGTGKQWMSWIHVEDIVRLYLFAAENQAAGSPLNGVRAAVTNIEFTRELGRVLHRPTILPVPKFGLKAAFGEMSEVLLSSARVVPKAAERLGFRYQYNDLQGALAASI